MITPLATFGLLDLGMPELVIIFALVLLFFGGKKLPELSKSLGQSIKELRKGVAEAGELKDQVQEQVAETREAWKGPNKAPVEQAKSDKFVS
jgi:sec-independent protein translocase protein TatA